MIILHYFNVFFLYFENTLKTLGVWDWVVK